MTVGRVDAIGFEDKANKTSYSTQVKKKKSLGEYRCFNERFWFIY